MSKKNKSLTIKFNDFVYEDYDFQTGGIDKETWKYINDNLDIEEMWEVVFSGLFEMINERILDMLNERDKHEVFKK